MGFSKSTHGDPFKLKELSQKNKKAWSNLIRPFHLELTDEHHEHRERGRCNKQSRSYHYCNVSEQWIHVNVNLWKVKMSLCSFHSANY